MATSSIAPRLCECGCGKPTRNASKTNVRRNAVKGQPLRFLPGHNNRGPRLPPIERFWRYVDKSPRAKGCWIWTASTNKGGYGKFDRNTAHRFSYKVHHGAITDNMMVLHTCDNPVCVNPSHLFLGTNLDNIADRHAKGRDAKGQKNGAHTCPERRPRGNRSGARLHPEKILRGERAARAKLTAAQVQTIRMRYASGGISFVQLGEEYGVSDNSISAIIKRLSWRHIE